MTSISSKALHPATVTWQHAQTVALAAAHVTSHSKNNRPMNPPTTFLSKLFAGFKLFGEAVTTQSQQLGPENGQWDRFGSLAAYAFSVYGISTFIVALILNRTTIIASLGSVVARRTNTRGIFALLRRLPVSQDVVLAVLRFLAVVLLASQGFNVLVALNVIGQNSPSPSQISRLTRWALLAYFQYDPQYYADSQYMSMPRDEVMFGPTSAMLWPVFLAVSYSLFIETFAAGISNTKPFLEGGLTLFELSLAIQEMSSGFFFLREHPVAKRPTEQILIVCLFLLADQILNQVGAVLYKNQYRLIPLTIISLMFMWYFCTYIRNGAIFTLPLEISLTYLALVLTLFVTFICGAIFILTVFTKGSRIDELNFASFFAEDDPNSAVFSQFLGLDLSQDFYTAAINLGMVAVTQTGKSSYFMAYNYVPSPRHTWLEQSLWDQLSRALDTRKTGLFGGDKQTHKILHFLNENHVSGYSNIINKPSKRLINGSEDETLQIQRIGTSKMRLMYLKETCVRFVQLLIWGIFQVIYYWPKRRYFKTSGQIRVPENESTEEFQTRRAQAPAFIRHLLLKSQNPLDKGAVIDKSSLETSIIEEDESPDFELVDEDDEETDVESDAELIDFLGANIESSELKHEFPEAYSSAISELMTPDNFIELFEDKEILHHHLQYEYAENGIMTRSRYRQLNNVTTPRDQTQELLDLMLLKRRTQLEKEAKTLVTAIDDDLDDLDPRIACVICQTEPRTLITWPCKCFAICEGCRVSLVGKGMKGCVCCRQDVEGVSRIFLP